MQNCCPKTGKQAIMYGTQRILGRNGQSPVQLLLYIKSQQHSLLVSALIMVPNLVMKYLQEENQAQTIPTKLDQTLMITSFISWYVIKANKELLQNL